MISRINGGAEKAFDVPEGWTMLADTEDSLYGAYQIIATPTTVIVGSDRRIVGFHPGYSPALAKAVRRDLLKAVFGEQILASSTPTPGMMNVQIGRMLARRGLWDRAAGYYEKAMEEEGALPPEIALEYVEVLLKAGRPVEAMELLDSVGESIPDREEVERLRARAEALMAGEETPAEPPKPR